MAELSTDSNKLRNQDNALRLKYTPEQIEKWYQTRAIDWRQRHELLTDRANALLEEGLHQNGIIRTLWDQAVRNLSEGWKDYLKFYNENKLLEHMLTLKKPGEEGKAPTQEEIDANNNQLSLMLTGIWGQIQMLIGIPNAVGEVAGKILELNAIDAGAPPGLARLVGYVSELGTSLFPVGKMAKSYALTVRHLAGAKAAGKQLTNEAVKTLEGEQIDLPFRGLLKHTDDARDIDLGHVPAGTRALDDTPTARYNRFFGGNSQGSQGRTTFETPDEKYARYFPATTPNPGALKGAPGKGSVTVNPPLTELEKDMAEVWGLGRGHQVGLLYDAEGREVTRHLPGDLPRSAPGGPTVGPRQPGLPGTSPRERIDPKTLMPDDPQAARAAAEAEFKAAAEAKAAIEKAGVSEENAANLARSARPPQLLRYIEIMNKHAKALHLMALDAANGGEKELMDFGLYVAQLFTSRPGADWARPPRAFLNMLTEWDPKAMASGNINAALETLALDFAVMDGKKLTALALTATALGIGMSGSDAEAGGIEKMWRGTREVYYNLLMPFAWSPTALGNSISTGNAVAERALGSMFGIGGSSNKEAFYLMKGMALAQADGIAAFKGSFGHMNPPSRWGSGGDVIPGRAGRLVRTPRDLTVGMDNYFKQILTRGSYYAQAIREAEQNPQLVAQHGGLGNFIQMRVGMPPQSYMVEAEEFAKKATFQSELSAIGEKFVSAMGHQANPLWFYFPFMRSYINVAKYSWNRTPGLQLLSHELYADIIAGGAKADQAIGKLIWANMLGIMMYDLARDGYIQGGGPIDPRLRRSWEAAGNVPYSIGVPGKRMPMQGKEPATQPMGMIADLTEIAAYMDPDEFAQTGLAITFAIINNFGEGNWIQGVGDFVHLLDEIKSGRMPSERSMDFLRKPLTEFATGGVLTNRIRSAENPIPREARGFIEGVQQRIPGWSRSLPPARDDYGDVIIPPQSWGGNWFGALLKPILPTFKGEEQADRVKKHAAEIQARMPFHGWTVGGRALPDSDFKEDRPEEVPGVMLTPEQRDRRIQIFRNLIRDPTTGIEKVMDAQQYNSYQDGSPTTPAYKRGIFEGYMQDRWKDSERLLLLMPENKDLQRKVIQNTNEAAKARMSEADKAQADITAKEAMKIVDQITLDSVMTKEQQYNLYKYDNPRSVPTRMDIYLEVK